MMFDRTMSLNNKTIDGGEDQNLPHDAGHG